MSPKRWALSLFFIWHVTAEVLGSLSAEYTGPPIGLPRHPENNALAATLTPILDSTATVIAPVRDEFTRVTAPLRQVTAMYLAVAGIAENWRMFSGRLDMHQYLRVRYYIAPITSDGQSAGPPSWTATELVLPAHREDRVRLFQAYRDSSRDKTLTIALGRFYRNRGEHLMRPDTHASELPDDLVPIGRYFARRFQREALRPDERIVRTEIWYGTAPIPPQDTARDRARTNARLAVLRDYYAGPVQNHFKNPVYPVYHAEEAEADIVWLLDHFEP